MSMAITVPPPGRLSTMTDWPQRSVSFCAPSRDIASSPPPGAMPITIRIGFVGKSSAQAAPVSPSAVMPAVQTAVKLRASLVMRSSPLLLRCAALHHLRIDEIGGVVDLAAQPAQDVLRHDDTHLRRC